MNYTSQVHEKKIAAFAGVFTDVQAVYVYKDLESNFLYANPFCLKFLGCKKDEQILGKNDHDFLWCEFADLYKNEEKNLIKTGSCISLVPSTNQQNEEVLFFSTRELIKDSQGNPIGILCQAKPITNKGILELSNLLNVNSKNGQKSVLTCEQNFSAPSELTKRERECLFFLLRGYSAKMIASIFFLTERAIEAHVERLKYKFNVHSKFELIATAIHMGYLYDIPKSLLNKRSHQRLAAMR